MIPTNSPRARYGLGMIIVGGGLVFWAMGMVGSSWFMPVGLLGAFILFMGLVFRVGIDGIFRLFR